MMKFFRKYNKSILAVVAVLMMIIFIAGDPLESLLSPRPEERPFGHAFGEPLTPNDQAEYETQTNILSNLGFAWNHPWGFDLPDRTGKVLEPLNTLDYMLLIREARRNGLRADLNRSREFLRTRAPRNLTQFRLELRVSEDEVERAVANMLMVQDAWIMAQSSINVSELDLNRAVLRMYEKLQAGIVSLRGEAFVDPAEEFDVPELNEQFSKYREQLRGSRPLDFGYMHPDRVKVEYIKIETAAIPLRRDVSRKVAETYWQEHKTEFPRPPKPAAAEPPAEGSEPAEQPESPYYETFAEVEDEVLARLRRQNRLEAAREMAEVLRQRLAQDWFGQEPGEDGYLPAPPGVESADYYRVIIDGLSSGLECRPCITLGTTGFFSQAEASSQEALGSSRQDDPRGGGMPFGRDIMRVQGLEVRQGDDPTGIGGPVAMFQTAQRVLKDESDNLYLYRIIGAQPAHSPATLEDVREQVVKDLRQKRAYERALEHARAFRQSVGETGLLASWQSFTGMPQELKDRAGSAFEAAPFAQITGTASPIAVRDKSAREENTIQSDEFVSQVYALLEAEGPGALGLIEAPELDRVFVVQLAGVNHLTPDEFKEKKQLVRFRVFQDRIERFKRAWFVSDKIRARCTFEFAT